MNKLNLKIAWRNLWKDRQFAILNITGLATGFAASLLIWLWVNNELDKGHFSSDDKRRFQVMHNAMNPSGIQTAEQTPGFLAATLKEQMPEVQWATSVIPASLYDKTGIVIYQDRRIQASRIMAGRDYFHIFPYHLLQGQADRVLADKYQVVISKDLALKLFHSVSEAVGKIILWNQANYSGSYAISGVFERPATEIGEPVDIILNYQLFLDRNPQKAGNWENNDASTFLLLKPGTDPKSLNEKMTALIGEKQQSGAGKNKSADALFVQPYSDRWLYDHYENGRPAGGRIAYVRLFSLIAIFILIVASINFTNLATAKAARRFREIGVKKVVGASRSSLIVQFLGEAVLMASLSLFAGLLIVLILLGPFNQISGTQLTMPFTLSFLLTVIATGLVVGIIAGSYPALYLSKFHPVVALKGGLRQTFGEWFVRKGLVTFQFALSVVFILAVIVVYRQVKFIRDKDLGYNRDHVIWFEQGGLVTDSASYYRTGGGFEQDFKTFLRRIRNIPGVVSVANFRHDITDRHGGTSDISWPGKPAGISIDFTDISAGYGFVETLGIKLMAGRSFSEDYGNESRSIILNETAAKTMGLKDPVGKLIRIWGEDRQIIGITRDFNFESLHETIKPCFIDFNFNHWASRVMVRIQAGSERQTIERLQQFYREANGGLALDYHFMDDDFRMRYEAENRIGELARWFAITAILISCLGLFGLVAFTAEKRKKELGIRKVVGATSVQVLALLSGDFLRLALFALCIGLPVSAWFLNRWLNGFAYRIRMNLSDFLITIAALLTVSLITISFQSLKAAFSNPARVLSSE